MQEQDSPASGAEEPPPAAFASESNHAVLHQASQALCSARGQASLSTKK